MYRPLVGTANSFLKTLLIGPPLDLREGVAEYALAIFRDLGRWEKLAIAEHTSRPHDYNRSKTEI